MIRKLIIFSLLAGFGLVATGAVTIPHTIIDDAIANAAGQVIAPVGSWASQAPVVQSISQAPIVQKVASTVGNALSFVGSIPGKALSSIGSTLGNVEQASKNAMNSLVPVWTNIKKGVNPLARVNPTDKSPLPLIGTMCLLLALIRAERKTLPLMVFAFAIVGSFFYYL